MYQPKQRVRITTDRWGEWDKRWGEGCELILESPHTSLAGLLRHWHVKTVIGGISGLVSESDIEPLTDEGPVRTVQRIIPGTYDGVTVGEVASVPRVEVHVTLSGYKDANELTRAAAVLTALAGALRDGE